MSNENKFEQFKKLNENSSEMRELINSCTQDELEMLYQYQSTKSLIDN